MKIFKIVKLTIIFVVPTLAVAQEFTIERVEMANDRVNIYYNLVDSLKNRSYTIDVYSSKDNYISRLEKVSGDIGLEVKPGGNHKITWAAKEELGSTFSGKVGLEVRGRLYIPFVRLEGLNKTYKRGKEFILTWTGGTQQNILNIDLYRGNEKVHPFSNIANVGKTSLIIPKDIKPRNDYYFKITDSKNKDQIVNTGNFTVKRKVPLAVKALGVAVIGFTILTVSNLVGSNSEAAPTEIPYPKSPETIHP